MLTIQLAVSLMLALSWSESANGSCDVDVKNFPILHSLQEGAKKGTWSKFITNENITISGEKGSPSLFRIEDGNITLDRDLDLDGPKNADMCQQWKAPGPVITISCTGSQAEKQLFFSLHFTDNHEPYFRQTSYSASIRELNIENQFVFQFKADDVVDDDCGTPPANYGITENDNFDISFGNITAKTVLDYEKQNEYLLKVGGLTTVTGAGSVRKTATTTLTISVVDFDDEDPQFESTPYVLNVAEGINSKDWMTSEPPIRAVDGDKGINAVIEYKAIDTSQGIKLEVNSSTGQIKIQSVLDREKIAEYKVTIMAFQKNNPLRSSTAELTINVEDVDDNLPRFLTKPETTPIKVLDGTPDGVFIIAVHATDDDEGDNAEFSYKLKDESGAFGIKQDSLSETGLLFIQNSSALEGRENVNVEVILEPKNKSLANGQFCDYVKTCVMTLEILVVNVNKHSPVFAQASYSFNIKSDDLHIGNVSATDDDRGRNGEISYKITESSKSCQEVKINETSGNLSLLKLLSEMRECFFSVQACDNPTDKKERRCTSVPVSVKVFEDLRSVYNASVYEGVPIGSIVQQLPDMDLQVTNENFAIKARSLVTITILDRETNPSYAVHLYGMPKGPESLSVVHVEVLDVNDNAPEFTKDEYTITLSQDIKSGGTVTQITATDADADSNANLTYSLVDGREWFSIDAKTGEITLIHQPLLEDGDEISVHLMVADGGSPPLIDTAVLEVYNPLFNTTTYLTLPINSTKVAKDTAGIEKFLSDTLKYQVKIEHIQDLPYVSDWSKLLISANREDGREIPRTALESMVQSHIATIQAHYKEKSSSKSSDDEKLLTTPFIIVLCVAVVLLLILVITIFLFWRKHKRYQRYASILKKLNTKTTIYDDAGKQTTIISPSVQELPVSNEEEQAESPEGTASVYGVTNPAYVPDLEGEDDIEGREHIFSDVEGQNVRENSLANQPGNDEIGHLGSGNVRENSLANQPGNDEIGHLGSGNVRENSLANQPGNDEIGHLGSGNVRENSLANQPGNDEIGHLGSGNVRENSLANQPGNDEIGHLGSGVETSPVHAEELESSTTGDNLYPQLPSPTREDDDVLATEDSVDLLHSQGIGRDVWKNYDADSGVPSDKDTADDEEEDSSSLTDDGLPSVGFFGMGGNARKDCDKPIEKPVTVGLTDINNGAENLELSPLSNSEDFQEPEPDYGKKVRFEEVKVNIDVENDGQRVHGDDITAYNETRGTDNTVDDSNSKYFVETEITAF